ncbi:MAG: BamA/TamA family outer membrane protein, partial [Hymenobacteraceae bacterium]|nr:BamA/TamA family outer membrane protein [Hymenobacteraceae bacterium]MDX5395393.1 BamA/TamA family outer membrane protein [Hymenobacteraceae bacterium]MDX5511442.1 BamA/TamA family outer membrane protein [Hymenobacteraceae bacterium]
QFSYYTQRYGKISFFAEYRSSRLLSTKGLQNLNTLPPYADITYTSYGINYLWNNLDNFYFPRKGFLGNFQVAIGNKTISRNIGLEPQLYDTIDLRSAQITLSGRTEYYFKLGKNSVLLTRLRAEALFNDQLFLNDMFRVGGLNTLRGFDEFFFYASAYGVGTAEYRIFTGDDSYFLLFFDQGIYRNKLEREQEWPFGLGGGISLSTGAGIFQFIYSVGQSEQQPFSFNTSKVHFGITNRF